MVAAYTLRINPGSDQGAPYGLFTSYSGWNSIETKLSGPLNQWNNETYHKRKNDHILQTAGL